MRRVISGIMCVVLCMISMIICGVVLAGPLQNAEEFQEKIIGQEEERSSNMGSGSDDNIAWQNDSGSSPSVNTTDQSDQQAQQSYQ